MTMVYQVVVKGPGLEGQSYETGLSLTFKNWVKEVTFTFTDRGKESREIGASSLVNIASVSASALVLEVFDYASPSALVNACADALVNAPSKNAASPSSSVHPSVNTSANGSGSQFAISVKVGDIAS